MAINEQNLVWIDLEMTGLDPAVNRIIEIATIVTDKDLNILAQGPVLAISQTQAHLDTMDEWNQKHHGQSGLVKRVLASTVTEDDAVAETIAFIEQYVPKGVSPLCGNSIGQDRRFLNKYMPKLEDFFHYRNLDVSSVKEITRRWAPHICDGFKKRNTHQALDDIRESIAELQYYREQVFKI